MTGALQAVCFIVAAVSLSMARRFNGVNRDKYDRYMDLTVWACCVAVLITATSYLFETIAEAV